MNLRLSLTDVHKVKVTRKRKTWHSKFKKIKELENEEYMNLLVCKFNKLISHEKLWIYLFASMELIKMLLSQ